MRYYTIHSVKITRFYAEQAIDDYTALCVETIIRHYTEQGIMTIRHHAEIVEVTIRLYADKPQ